MSDPLLRCGEAEAFKGAVHLAVFGLAVTCLGYASMAWSERRERHLVTNVLVYGWLSWFEAQQILRHLRAWTP